MADEATTGNGKFIILENSDGEYLVETPDGAQTEEWFEEGETAYIEYDGVTYAVIPDDSGNGFAVHSLGAKEPCEVREYDGEEGVDDDANEGEDEDEDEDEDEYEPEELDVDAT